MFILLGSVTLSNGQKVEILLKDGTKRSEEIKANSATQLFVKGGTINYADIESVKFDSDKPGDKRVQERLSLAGVKVFVLEHLISTDEVDINDHPQKRVNIASAQLSTSDIVKATLGKSYFNLNKTLDSLGVWYYMHLDVEKSSTGKQDLKKIYSIEDGFKSTKVYSFKLNIKNIIDEIIVNFRHDVKEDAVEIGTITTHSDFHVGIYSTDFVFRKK
jgi:hypothetical protein